jgi:hypothetical protein
MTVVLLLLSMVFANSIVNAADEFKNLLCQLAPTAIVIAFVFGALAYAISQILPGDQKARVQQVGGGAIVVAVLAGIILVLGPWVIQTLTEGQIVIGCSW